MASSQTSTHELTATLNRWSPLIKGVSLVLIVVGIVLIVRQLPLGPVVEALGDWVKQRGAWGPVVFGLVYVVAVVLLVPASVLTLVAGAVFGLLVGTITVSLASTTGAALAFLIGRYLARERVARTAQQYPTFGAIDRAVSEGGWKIVALLRLSPAVPFNLQNYLYGVTGIRFWPCVLTSWLAMLPGTFLYIYLGYAAGSVAGGEAHSPWQWVALAAGLVATVVVTVYVTHLARKALKQRAHLPETTEAAKEQPAGRPWGTVVAVVAALLTMGVAIFIHFPPGRDLVQRLFAPLSGPPRVTLKEVYKEKPNGPTFDHSKFDELVHKYVQPGGWVDYRGLKGDAAKLDAYLDELAHAPFDEMGRTPKLALLLNAYNAFTLRLILDHYPIDSIRSIPAKDRWEAVRWHVGRHTWSLNQIEHEQIRPKFIEPRLHFALVCAAIGCPPLRSEAYQPDRLNEQLDSQARYVHSHPRWFQLDLSDNVVRLTQLYKWYGDDFKQALKKLYGEDFKQVADAVLHFAARYSPALKEALDGGQKPRIEWLKYDWRLNSVDNKPPSAEK